jgi:hypothetical protein
MSSETTTCPGCGRQHGARECVRCLRQAAKADPAARKQYERVLAKRLDDKRAQALAADQQRRAAEAALAAAGQAQRAAWRRAAARSGRG